jgi:hypothetical protein
MTTIADCNEGEIINIPQGRFIVHSVEDATGLFGLPEKSVILYRVDDDGLILSGEENTLRFQGAESMVLR